MPSYRPTNAATLPLDATKTKQNKREAEKNKNFSRGVGVQVLSERVTLVGVVMIQRILTYRESIIADLLFGLDSTKQVYQSLFNTSLGYLALPGMIQNRY